MKKMKKTKRIMRKMERRRMMMMMKGSVLGNAVDIGAA